MASKKDWARFYKDKLGWSVFPVGQHKKPLLKKVKGDPTTGWRPYQTTLATDDQINEWWTKWPEANIAVATGRLSGISVIDIDSYKQPGTLEYVMALFWDWTGGGLEEGEQAPWMECVKAITPRGGEHWFFAYNPDLVSRTVAPNVDVKSDGGYVLISPSDCDDNRYRWIRPPWEGRDIYGNIPFPEVYHSIWSKDRPFSPMAGSAEIGSMMPDLPVTEDGRTPIDGGQEGVTDRVKPWANRLISFEQGGRDETLFHVANTLVLGGMPIQNVELVVEHLAAGCDPPFKDAGKKIISALQRGEDRLRPLAQEIREWLEDIDGIFTSKQLDSELRINTKTDKRNRRKILSRLVEDGIVEKFNIAGKFRKVLQEATPMNYLNAEPTTRYSEMKFALDEHRLFLPMEKNIIIVAGAPDAGKTSWILRFLELNNDLFDIDYYCSDMGELELKKRLMDVPTMKLDDWNFNAYEQEDDFHDVINPNGVSVVDFLEMHDNFYLVAQKIYNIWDKLEKGLCIVAIQKNPGVLNPLGGQRAMEKARMVIGLDHQKGGMTRARFLKCKNWRTPENPRGLYRDFYIEDGCQFTGEDPEWHRDENI